MASRSFEMVIFTALAAMLFLGASANPSSCSSALINLSPCLNYITGNEITPTRSCCSQVSAVVQSVPQCLCVVLKHHCEVSWSIGITVNQTQALALPAACNVYTPPVGKFDSQPGSPSPAPSSPLGGESKTTPAPAPSDGSSVNIPVFLIFSLLFVAAASSSTTLVAF